MNFASEALRLHNAGFAVFPLHGINTYDNSCTCGNEKCGSASGKHPRFKSWQAAALHSGPKNFDIWETQYEFVNLGIATGYNNLVVIDVDDLTCELAIELLPQLPATLSARTGREGGLHRYYRVPKNPFTVHTLGGIDIRGSGGLVVAPPSKHYSGATYEWVNWGTAIAELPTSVVDFLLSRLQSRKEAQRVFQGGLVPEGQRHDFLRGNAYKRAMTGKMTEGEVLAIMEKTILPQVENPASVSQEEIRKLVQGAFEKRSVFTLSDRSEVGVADKFTEFWRGNLVYVQGQGWFSCTDGIWKPELYPESLFKVVREAIYAANIEGNDEHRKAIEKLYGNIGTFRYAEAIIRLAKPAFTRSIEEFQIPHNTLPFQNGLYFLDTGAFRPFLQDDNVIHRLTCAYDPAASAPKWESAISYIVGGDSEAVRFHRQVFGYLLSTLTMRGVFFFVGPKSTGKTTLVSTIAEILTRYAGTAQLGLIHTTRGFSEDEDAARAATALVGKHFVYMDETRQDATIDTSEFKRIASRDAVLTGRYLRHDAFTFTNKAKIVVLTNNEPNIAADDDAAWDRVLYVPFWKSIPKEQRKEGFKEELLAEASGIMNWCIEGYKDVQEHGFIIPGSVTNQIELWRTEDNPLAQFIEMACILEKGASVKSQELYDQYNTWKEAMGFGFDEGKYTSQSSFTKALLRLCGDTVSSARTSSKRTIVGIKRKGQ